MERSGEVSDIVRVGINQLRGEKVVSQGPSNEWTEINSYWVVSDSPLRGHNSRAVVGSHDAVWWGLLCRESKFEVRKLEGGGR